MSVPLKYYFKIYYIYEYKKVKIININHTETLIHLYIFCYKIFNILCL